MKADSINLPNVHFFMVSLVPSKILPMLGVKMNKHITVEYLSVVLLTNY